MNGPRGGAHRRRPVSSPRGPKVGCLPAPVIIVAMRLSEIVDDGRRVPAAGIPPAFCARGEPRAQQSRFEISCVNLQWRHTRSRVQMQVIAGREGPGVGGGRCRRPRWPRAETRRNRPKTNWATWFPGWPCRASRLIAWCARGASRYRYRDLRHKNQWLGPVRRSRTSGSSRPRGTLRPRAWRCGDRYVGGGSTCRSGRWFLFIRCTSAAG